MTVTYKGAWKSSLFPSGWVDSDISFGGAYQCTGLQAPAASAEALIRGTRVTAAELLDGTANYALKGAGAGASPAYGQVASSELNKDVRWTLDDLPIGATSGQVLTAQGAGVSPAYAAAPGGATKQFFAPATHGTEAVPDVGYLGVGYRIDATAEIASLVFMVPDDFVSVSEFTAVIYCGSAGTPSIAVATDFSASGEVGNTHTDTATISTGMSTDYTYEVDISAALTGIAVGDSVRVKFTYGGTGGYIIMGVWFKYA